MVNLKPHQIQAVSWESFCDLFNWLHYRRNGRSISSSVVVQSIDVSKHKYIRHYYSCSVIISDLVMSSAIPSKWKVNVAYNTMSKFCGSIIKNDSQKNNCSTCWFYLFSHPNFKIISNCT